MGTSLTLSGMSPFISLPEGFVCEEGPGFRVAYRAELKLTLQSAGFFHPQQVENLGTVSSLSGRGNLRRLEWSSGSALLRQYRHGGLLRFLTGSRFCDGERPLRELSLTAQIFQSGIPTPPPLAAATFGSFPFYRLFYLSQEIQGQDLLSFLQKEKDFLLRQRVLERAGQLIRRLHDFGVFHADLHPKNLFVENGTQRVLILDLDRSQKFSELSQAQRLKNLTRLYRYGKRIEYLHRDGSWNDDAFLQVLRAYDPTRPQLKPTVSWIHRFGWQLEKLSSLCCVKNGSN